MQQTRNSHKAFISYDAMFSILPIVFMVSFIIQMMAITVSDANYVMDKRETFNFLVASADYMVKIGAARTDDGGNLIPNWVKDQDELGLVASDISARMGFAKNISVYLDEPQETGTCIYRLVVVGGSRPEDGEIKKLYVCG